MKKLFAVLLTAALFSTALQARKVSGTVKCGNEKLSGVIVTDGQNFTQTKKGKFKFEIEDKAEFVYIVTPSGYAADWSSGVPAFYQSAADKDKFAFELKKIGDGTDYSIIAIADPQTKNDKHFEKFAAEPMSDLCATAEELGDVTVGLALGDICWDSLEMLEKYRKEIVRTGIPFYPVVGNHDHDKDAQGDVNTIVAYRKIMGPENYAFFLGKDVVIVLDNIIYDTRKKYKEGYADHVLAWVKGLENLLPETADLYIAQHSPVLHWDHGNRKIVNSHDLFGLVCGHEVHFISGHTHINNNFDYDNDIYEHNVAAICGSWWDTEHCTDGTPRGYKVFTKKDGNLTWYYKSVDYPKSHQLEVFLKGESPLFPESILVNVWDWDPQWSITWYEDGVFKGELETVMALSPQYVKEINSVFDAIGKQVPKYKKPRMNYHYFAVEPAKDAEKVKICIRSRFGQTWEHEVNMK